MAIGNEIIQNAFERYPRSVGTDIPISDEYARFDFKNGVANNFNEHVVNSVLGYNNLQSYITNLTKHFLNNKQNISILDLGCSTGTLLNKIIYNNPVDVAIGVDYSKEMIEKAMEIYSESNIDFKTMDITNDFITKYGYNHDIITSMLTMQFISLEHRKGILQKVYDSLYNGGCFFLVEKVLEPFVEINNIFVQEYKNFKKTNGFTEKEIIAKDESLVGVQRPLTLNENIKLLENIGFTSVTIFYKELNFVGIMALKREI